jgi:hypothetical protein
MPIELNYQPQIIDPAERLQRTIWWIGLFLSIAGGAVMLGAGVANAQYVDSYPLADVVVFCLGIVVAPVFGVGMLWCSRAMRRGSHVAVKVAISLVMVIALLCLGVMCGAGYEAMQSASRGTPIDATITVAGGVCIPALAGVWCVRLILRLWRY